MREQQGLLAGVPITTPTNLPSNLAQTPSFRVSLGQPVGGEGVGVGGIGVGIGVGGVGGVGVGVGVGVGIGVVGVGGVGIGIVIGVGGVGVGGIMCYKRYIFSRLEAMAVCSPFDYLWCNPIRTRGFYGLTVWSSSGTIYNMCTHKPPHDYSQQLYDKYHKSFQEYITSTGGSNYPVIIDHVNSYLWTRYEAQVHKFRKAVAKLYAIGDFEEQTTLGVGLRDP
ncbi:hypothetical protein IFM89_028873 [Coptis chinensis]|uniref:Uncharacterized protein n=1 Tax=Coptis chinensis TaxID=261450 RepID=A0A835H7S5_9MAGN|nr:hypothetical protein IFM89_028873 [Coptis chinensis]